MTPNTRAPSALACALGQSISWLDPLDIKRASSSQLVPVNCLYRSPNTRRFAIRGPALKLSLTNAYLKNAFETASGASRAKRRPVAIN
jgi:hypothetical protein